MTIDVTNPPAGMCAVTAGDASKASDNGAALQAMLNNSTDERVLHFPPRCYFVGHVIQFSKAPTEQPSA